MPAPTLPHKHTRSHSIMHKWARLAIQTLVAVNLLYAVVAVIETHAARSDMCALVESWVPKFIRRLCGLPDMVPKNPTWCYLTTKALSPGTAMAVAHTFVDACLAALAQHPMVVFLLVSGAVSVFAWPWYSRRTFERRHNAPGRRHFKSVD